MKLKFTNFLKNEFKGENVKIEEWWNVVENNYKDPKRKYHNLSHIQKLLEIYEKFEDKVEDKSTMQLSIWFHE